MAKVLASGLSRNVLPKNEVRVTQLNTPSDAAKALPYYNLLPTDPVELLKWKIYVRERCQKDLEFRATIWAACRDDVAFFAATFCHVFEPRPPRNIPFTPWVDQVDVMAWMRECIDTSRDAGVEKTRGIGMSWTMSIVLFHAWLFTNDCKIGVMTKDETTLDGPDSNYLLGKFAYLFDHMPAWVRFDSSGRSTLKRNTSEHLLIYLPNGSTIQGFPPMPSKVRGLRFSIFAYDEFAFFPRDAQESLNASVHTAPTRFFISTWRGAGNKFHTIMRRDSSTMLRIETYWWNNPERWKGCYRFVNGQLEVIDKGYKFPPDFPFVDDGLLRSPWVDFELSRAGSDMQSALEELYGLQSEAGRKFFKPATVDIANASIVTPTITGRLDVSRGQPVFVPGGGTEYEFSVWGDIGAGASGPFSVGCDLSHGQGAAYSTCEVIDHATGKQCLEYVTNCVSCVDFARYVVGICRWLAGDRGDGHVMLTFENNGPLGNVFAEEITRLGYGNVDTHKRRSKVTSRDKAPTYLGMRNTDGGMGTMAEMERAMNDGQLTVVSRPLAAEIETFDKDEKGQPLYPAGYDGHGDRVQGLALAWWIARGRIKTAVKEDIKESANAEIRNFRPQTARWSDRWRITRNQSL